MARIDEDVVRARAYQLWEEGGRVDGDHEEHWRRAQAECAGTGDGVDEDDTPASMDDTNAVVSTGIDGEISRPLIDVKSKPRQWPAPTIDA